MHTFEGASLSASLDPRKMAQYVIAGTQAVDGETQTVVGMADAAQHIQSVAIALAQQNKDKMNADDNDYNIRK